MKHTVPDSKTTTDTNHSLGLEQQLQHQITAQDEKIHQLEFLVKKYKEQIETMETQSEENRLRAEVAEIYLDNVVRNINEHFYWMDKDGLMLGCNEQQAKSFGLNNSEELLGKNIYDFLYSLKWSSDIVEAIRENNIHVMRAGKTVIKEEIGFFAGEEHTFISYKNPLLNKQKKVIGVFGFSIDITDRKRAEQALLATKEELEVALRSKTEFLENMRHDLRTPFSGIVGLAQSLEMRETDPEKKEVLDWVVKSSTQVLNVLNDILAGANTGTIKQPKSYDIFSVNDIVDNLNDLLIAEIHHKKLDFYIEIDPQIPAKLAGDKMRLHQILLNLLTNAVKFTDTGKIELNIMPGQLKSDYLEVIFVIKDSGIGIPKSKLDTIFNKFSKLKPSFLSNTYVGVGVGLSIVKNLVAELKGTIQIESKEEKGTVVTCSLPFDIPT